MALEVKGHLYKKFETQSKTESFQIREFVLKLDGQYPQLIKFQLTQDRCDLLNAYNEGDEMEVHFDLRGREWNDKFLTNLNAWKLNKVQAEEAPPVTGEDAFPPFESNVASQPENQPVAEDFKDDLPF